MKILRHSLPQLILLINSLFFLNCSDPVPPPNEALGITFSDENLANCVKESGYESIEKVTELLCPNKDITDISGVEQFENLEKVDFSSNDIENAAPLSKLGQLKFVDMDSTNIDSVSVFSDNKSLVELRISYTLITDLEPLKDFPTLRTLAVSGTEVNWEILKSLNQLTSLELINCNVEVEQVLSLDFIVELNISSNAIPDVIPLSTMKKLEKLSLRNTDVSRGVGELSYLASLEEVDLAGNTNIPCNALDQLRNSLGEEAVKGVTECIENPIINWCGKDIPIDDHADILNHTIVLRSMYSENSELRGLFFARFVSQIILNGLNFAEKDDWDLSFVDNQYRFGTENDFLFITFVFTEDFGNFSAGDTIPYDLTSQSTFIPKFKVTPPKVDIFDPLDSKLPTLTVTEKGPLFELADWDVEWDKLIPKIRVRFPNLGAIGVTFGSKGTYHRIFQDTTYEGNDMVIDSIADSLDLNMYMPLTTFRQFKKNIDEGVIKISVDGTEYKSNYFKIHQTLFHSSFDLDFKSGEWKFGGLYDSKFTRAQGDFYSESRFSNFEENFSDFYCDADHEEKLGTARHLQYWPFGVYTSVGGEKFYYMLVPF